MHNESGDPSPIHMNPHTVQEYVGHYGVGGAEWIGADRERYRTNGSGFGMYRLNGSVPVPGMERFALQGAPSQWAQEINTALAARDTMTTSTDGRSFTREYTRETHDDGTVWFYGTCPELPGCMVYSQDESEIVDLLREAIRVMSAPIPNDHAREASDE